MKQTNKGFRIGSHILLGIGRLIVIVPFLLLVSSSFTREQTLIARGYSILPREFGFEAYRYLFAGAGNIFKAYGITFLVTVLGTAAGLLMTVLLAYALSVEKLPFRKSLSFFVFFTMLFNGGLIPTYMMYTNVFHIKNTLAALIVPSLMVNAFFVIIARSYFSSSIPAAVLEAARIDGIGEIRLFFEIVMPMSLPIVATIGLMIGLGYWNNWTNGLYYITDHDLYSVQQLLTEMVRNMQALQSGEMTGLDPTAVKNLPSTSLRMATAVMSVLPVLLIYPAFQKYFVKGITVGAVKG